MMHIDGCQSVLYVAKQVRRSDRGVGANVSPVQNSHNGNVPPERQFIGFDAYKKAIDCLTAT